MYVIGHNSGHNFCFLVHGYAWNNLTHSTNPHHISGVFFEHTKFHKGDKHRNEKIIYTLKKSIELIEHSWITYTVELLVIFRMVIIQILVWQSCGKQGGQFPFYCTESFMETKVTLN